VEKLLRPIDLDDLLGLPVGRAEKLARQLQLPHVVLPDGAIRFRLTDIQVFISHGIFYPVTPAEVVG
jgi:hypothetical protein